MTQTDGAGAASAVASGDASLISRASINGNSPWSVASIRWPTPQERPARSFAPLGPAGHDHARIRRPLGPGIAGRDQRHGLAAVGQGQRHRRPGHVAQVGRLLDLDLLQSHEGDPVVAAVDDGLEHRPQAGIGVGHPGERLVVDRPRDGRRRLEGLVAQLGAPPRTSRWRPAATPAAAARPTRPARRTPAATCARRTPLAAAARSAAPRGTSAAWARLRCPSRPPPRAGWRLAPTAP